MPEARYSWRLILALVLSVQVCAGALVALSASRHRREAAEARQRKQSAARGPRVTVAQARTTVGFRDVTLPADVRAFAQATLYAKTTGYLLSITVDRGDRVKTDQLLGVIQSPETDQQVSAAISQFEVKRRDALRARELAAGGALPQQEVDHAEGDSQVASASLARVRALQAYQQVRAPFAGVVTARYVDRGALLQGGVPIVDVSDATRVKVTIYAGQDLAPFLRVGDPVTLVQDERPQVVIDAPLTRLSDALDPRSRTMRCEVWLDNDRNQLYPGTFMHATLHVEVPPLPTVPSEAVFVRGGSPYVAVIEGTRARFVAVQLGLDNGQTVQIARGLQGTERVALNFPSELSDGAEVQPVEQRQRAPDAGAVTPRM